MMNRGFTLVEILVVIAIVAIVGMIMLAIFSNTLRGSNKSQILAAVKQNGQAVLENMGKVVRDADNVVCPLSSGATLVIVKNGIYTRYRFVQGSCGSANGCLQQDNPPSYSNSICSDSDALAMPITITDTNPQSGVSVVSGLFTRNKQPGFKDSVTISFTLRPGASIPAAISNQIDPVAFQTTVELR